MRSKVASPPNEQEHSMKIGFLATSVALFSLAGMVPAQPPVAGKPSPKTEPALLQDCVQLGRPVPLREVSKPAAPPTGPARSQPPGMTTVGNCCAAASSCWEQFCAQGTTTCEPAGRVWASAEYLLWWFEGSRVPPL